ncbi:hypothetical protein [Clostridium sp. L74]|uniref:hypothetical protein n=1 Tax=Clostridium sp. L74 TaxID=1560217 RepID=UPI0006ABC901|nr:hypothetical protein [Clostridium sp. L74]KOR26813.1 hypothetical protein ND00_03400 [Clostridium sp. L74]
MELNKKILHIGLLLIGVSLIFTITFASVYKLENPVFLKMFVEKSIYPNEDSTSLEIFELKYITNISDNRKIANIEFKENQDIEVTVSDDSFDYQGMPFFNDISNNQRENKYGIYVVNTIYFNMNLKNIDRKLNEIKLNNVKITFNDGSTLETNLGKIILYEDKNKNKDREFVSSSASSDNEFSSTIKLKNNIKLLKVDTPLLHDTKDYFDLSIDNIDYKDISGKKYEKGAMLSSHSKFKITNSILKKYSYYEIQPKLYYKDNNANESYMFIDNIHYNPNNFDFMGIFQYLRLRGVD